MPSIYKGKQIYLDKRTGKRLLLLPVLLAALLAIGCAQELIPTPSSPPTLTPTVSTRPTSEATPTVPHISIGPSALVLPVLVISTAPSDIPSYDRNEWRHWVDTNGNCRNTRHDVLVIESIVPVTFRDGGECFVIAGRWIDPFTGVEVTDPAQLDVDHMVPLQNAHISGAWEWDHSRKEAYANFLDYDGHLIAVTASANRSKGSKAPHEWRPPSESYWCDYAIDWITIKATWSLFAVEAEWKALLEMLATCTVQVVFDDGATVIAIATPPPTATVPAAAGCVDINSASLEDLQRIVHIGEARALEVVALRPFSSVQGLSRVSGIGPARLEDILNEGLACVP